MKTLTVKASKTYDVIISSSFDDFTKELINVKKALVLTDEDVFKACYPKFESFLKNTLKGAGFCVAHSDKKERLRYYSATSDDGPQIFVYVIPSGDASKNKEEFFGIAGFLYENDFTRADLLITYGGGMVGDLGAFVASTYMRGMRLFALPVSLIGMIDSSVGGKAAINFGKVKNLIGTFYEPDLVYINIPMLKTLPPVQFLSGAGELAKYCYLTGDNILSDTFDSLPAAALFEKANDERKAPDPTKKDNAVTACRFTPADVITEEVVFRCLKYKVGIIEKDETDLSCRRLLNFGHTFGHAVEALSEYKIPHGVAVIKGMYKAIDISGRYYGYSPSVAEDLKKILLKTKVGPDLYFDKDLLLEKIKHDKKTDDNFIDFVFIRALGDCSVEKVDISRIGELF